MGSRTSKTNLNVEQILDECDVPRDLTKSTSFTVRQGDKEYRMYMGGHNYEILNSGVETTHVWTPNSHMRDFEVIDPFTENEIKIARGQGIGVIIVPPFNRVIKLFYEKGSITHAEMGVYQSLDELSRVCIHPDLGIGYDILVLEGKSGFRSYCEERDDRDEQSTTILFPWLSNMASYNSGDKNISSDDE